MVWLVCNVAEIQKILAIWPSTSTENLRVGGEPQDGEILGLTISPTLLARAGKVIE
jgi:hypothetical protein